MRYLYRKAVGKSWFPVNFTEKLQHTSIRRDYGSDPNQGLGDSWFSLAT
jgi:hypothetical protein